MSPSRLDVTMRFKPLSGFHITGEEAVLGVDKVLVRAWEAPDAPVIPATSLKGWLRDNVEKALRGLGGSVCDGSQPSSVCGRCPVCEVFGSPRGRSPLRFADVRLEGSAQDVRMNVALSRRRRTAYEERLFSTQVAWPTSLEGCVRGIFPSPEQARRAAALLWLGTRTGLALGAARSRGLGWLELQAFSAEVDGSPLTNESLAEEVRTLVTGAKSGPGTEATAEAEGEAEGERRSG